MRSIFHYLFSIYSEKSLDIIKLEVIEGIHFIFTTTMLENTYKLQHRQLWGLVFYWASLKKCRKLSEL